MSKISTELIKQAVYKLCFEANTIISSEVYSKIYSAYKETNSEETKDIFRSILLNAQIAYKTQKPLCQDTGQVIVFLEIGQNIQLEGEFIEDAINSAIKECYIENFFRKSVVQNAIFNRSNTKTNTPAIIYTKYTKNDEIKIKVLIKGGGAENKSQFKMFLPTTNEKELINNCADLILSSGENSCPPLFIGIGIGGTAEKAALASKEVFFETNFSFDELRLATEIKNTVNIKALERYSKFYLLDVKLLTLPTHIACLPVFITINCHSDRFSSCTIKNNTIFFNHKTPDFIKLDESNNNFKEVSSSDIETIKSLKQGEKILLSGEIFVARDMAHKRLYDIIQKNEQLPFEIKNKIIFYAGPCPNKPNEIIGSIGPTTSSRMDEYAIILYDMGLLASIGKGDRNIKVNEIILKNNAKYFTVTGGIAALLSENVKKSQIIAFEDLGTEAVYKLTVEKLPLEVQIG